MPEAGKDGLTLAEIAARLGGDVLGDAETRIFRVATLASAGAGAIAFLANPKYRGQLASTQAAAVILSPKVADAFDGPRLVIANPYAAYARVASWLYPPAAAEVGIHPSAVVESPVPPSASIGPGVCIGRDVVLGEGVVVRAGCVIDDDVHIGAGSLLYPRVSIYRGCRVGARAIIHSGAVIGADGFGFAPDAGTWVKIPQVGKVVIGDDVEIGANTTVDRGALDDTLIGDGCKIDNQVQIAHNCRIGAHSVIAGCAGIAGSVTLGEHCIIGGAAMLAGHLTLVAGTTVSGGSFVTKSIKVPGVYTSLFPLDEHDEWARNASLVRRLPRLVERLAQLEKQREADASAHPAA